MIATPDFRKLVRQIASFNPTERTAARMILCALEEDAVEPLIDEFYAGVNDTEGIAILTIMAEIGGPDALSTLRSVYTHEEERIILKLAAALGLLRNQAVLSPDEIVDISAFVRYQVAEM